MGKAGVQVLVATSTLAWGVNTPAHLVIIKGTEYFDAPTRQALHITRTRAQGCCSTAGVAHSLVLLWRCPDVMGVN